MKVTLNTNIASLKAQGTLGKVEKQLSSVFERLSTGMRINKPGDDPAGLQIADALKAESQLTGASIRNMNDAVSAINIASAGLESQQKILYRMAELAEQASNGVYSYEQRKPLDAEYQQLMQEFDRIAEATEFNGIKLLRNKGATAIQIQAGTDGSANSRLEFEAVNSHSMAGVLGLRSNFDGDDGVGFVDINVAITRADEEIDDSAYLGYTFQFIEVVDSLGKERTIAVGMDTVQNDLFSLMPDLNPITQIGVVVYDIAEDGTIRELLESSMVNFVNAPFDAYTDTVTLTDTGATADISIDISELDFQHLDTGGTVYQNPGTSTLSPIISTPTKQTAIGFTSVRYQYTAAVALDTVKNRMDEISALRGSYGAIQSRLGVAIDTAGAIAESVIGAESRIRDADIAAETAELVRLQILQQASAAILGQANSTSSVVLQLLGR